MKKNIVLLFSVLSLAFLSCDKKTVAEVETDIQLQFKANYGGAPFYTFKDYQYQDGKAIRFNNFNFFVSDISLVNSESSVTKTELLEVDNINLSFTEEQATEAATGKLISVKHIPVGKYDGLKIGFGVSPDLNRTAPADYGAGHPLASNYWDGWSSYIFSIIEGYADMNNDGTITTGGANTEVFSYHSGTDDVYTQFTFGDDIELIEGETKTLVIHIDVKKLFKYTDADKDINADGYLDIESFSGTHSNEEGLPIAKSIMNNFRDAVTVSE